MCLGLFNYDDGLTSSNSFRDDVEAVEGEDLLAKSFPAGANAPTEIVVSDPSKAEAVTVAVSQVEGVSYVRTVVEKPEGVLLNAVLVPEPYSTDAFDLITPIRDAAHEAGGDSTLVGGGTAVEFDIREANTRDSKVIVPIVLIVVFLILMLLLRSVLAPLLLTATVVLSFFAALGVGFVASDVLFGFPGVDSSIPLYRLRVPGGPGDRLQHLPDGPGPGGDRTARDQIRHVAGPRRDRRGDHFGRNRAGRNLLGSRGPAAGLPHPAGFHSCLRRPA